jgi:hypothetical protein
MVIGGEGGRPQSPMPRRFQHRVWQDGVSSGLASGDTGSQSAGARGSALQRKARLSECRPGADAAHAALVRAFEAVDVFALQALIGLLESAQEIGVLAAGGRR